jgi:adenine-specific DNA-methyltransferase
MQNLLSQAYDLLKQDERLLSTEWDLLKNKIQELAYKLDEKLIGILLSDAIMKEKFFVSIKDVVVFDQKKFVQFINNKEFLPDSYTAFKNKIGLTDSRDQFVSESNDVVLDRPYKDCILAGGQDKEDARRDEIFYNEILWSDQIDRLLDPKVFTNFKKYTVDGEQKVQDFTRDENNLIKDNLIIKGNNLITLNSINKHFAWSVKLVYADPPYNTWWSADVFKYNNTFKHSTWLTFMKNRLEVAREILSEDWFLALTIDHEELFYLWTLTDQIFGKDNRVWIVTVYINPKGRQHEKFFSASTEYMLVYAKNIKEAEFNKVTIDDEKRDSFRFSDDQWNYRLEQFIRARTNTLRVNKPNFWYPIYVSPDLLTISDQKYDWYIEIFPVQNNKEFTWKTNKETFIKRNNDWYFIAERNIDGTIQIVHKYREQQVFKNIWLDKKYFSEFNGTNVVKKLLWNNVFSYPKSLYAVKDTIKIMTSDDDIILDFFGWSGTTAHAVLELNKDDWWNRRFILTEQMDYINTVTVPRVKKVIENNENGEFIYMEIAQNNEKLIQAIHNAEHSQELISLYHQLKESSFINYKIDIKTIDANISEFENLSLEDMKRFLSELIDKNALYINYSEINDASYAISEEDKALNKKFYQ